MGIFISNKKIANIFKNLSYTIASNFISLVISSLVVLIVPKLIGVEDYGYFQLYLLYTSYVGFMHFGWNDGILLRYGGKNIDELDVSSFTSQFSILIMMQVIFVIVGVLITNILSLSPEKKYIFYMTFICMLLVNMRRMLIYIMQSVNHIKDYSLITIVDRGVYLITLLAMLFIGFRNFKVIISLDLFGKFISLVIAMYMYRGLIFKGKFSFVTGISEGWNNVIVGIKLMIANIASILVVGIIRMCIEDVWSITVFAQVSLILSISNLIMIFINAISVVMFPLIKRTNELYLADLYIKLRAILMALLLLLVILSYPIKFILLYWLPSYSESLKYIAFLFPMIVFQGRIMLLTNTYLKAYRKEKEVLRSNLLTLLLSGICAFATTYILHNLDYAVFSILLVFIVRGYISEYYLNKVIDLDWINYMISEISLIIVFVVSFITLNALLSLLLYLVAYSVYIFFNRKQIINTLHWTKRLLIK